MNTENDARMKQFDRAVVETCCDSMLDFFFCEPLCMACVIVL